MPFNTRLLSACALAVASAGVALNAGSQRPVEIPDRIRGAERVVVAQVARRDARYQRNQFGDELIVSRVVLQVHEMIKGTPARVINLELEGGTVDDVTMHVSDLPGLEPGERGVFFLDQGEADLHVPHLRGQGILKLDEMDRVDGSSLTLDMIREMARQAR
jgi:hypothetical protein